MISLYVPFTHCNITNLIRRIWWPFRAFENFYYSVLRELNTCIIYERNCAHSTFKWTLFLCIMNQPKYINLFSTLLGKLYRVDISFDQTPWATNFMLSFAPSYISLFSLTTLTADFWKNPGNVPIWTFHRVWRKIMEMVFLYEYFLPRITHTDLFILRIFGWRRGFLCNTLNTTRQ